MSFNLPVFISKKNLFNYIVAVGGDKEPIISIVQTINILNNMGISDSSELTTVASGSGLISETIQNSF